MFYSCTENYFFKDQTIFENQVWTYQDLKVFTVPIEDTLTLYNLYLEVEHATDYSFQNLYTKIITQFPAGEKLEKIVSLEFSNKSGIWLGECNSSTCILRIPIQEDAFFNQTGNYIFSIEQFMREDAIEGLKSLTFYIQDTGQNRKPATSNGQ